MAKLLATRLEGRSGGGHRGRTSPLEAEVLAQRDLARGGDGHHPGGLASPDPPAPDDLVRQGGAETTGEVMRPLAPVGAGACQRSAVIRERGDVDVEAGERVPPTRRDASLRRE